jgi:hypothetical protein
VGPLGRAHQPRRRGGVAPFPPGAGRARRGVTAVVVSWALVRSGQFCCGSHGKPRRAEASWVRSRPLCCGGAGPGSASWVPLRPLRCGPSCCREVRPVAAVVAGCALVGSGWPCCGSLGELPHGGFRSVPLRRLWLALPGLGWFRCASPVAASLAGVRWGGPRCGSHGGLSLGRFRWAELRQVAPGWAEASCVAAALVGWAKVGCPPPGCGRCVGLGPAAPWRVELRPLC